MSSGLHVTSPVHTPLTKQDLQRARIFAEKQHNGQTLKAIHPTLQKEYIAHALDVTKTLKRHGANIPEQIAGLVHGIPKNVPVRSCVRTRESEKRQLNKIESLFGREVRVMVAGITDLPPNVTSWLSRKRHHIQQIEETAILVPKAYQGLVPSILKLSIADEHAAMAALIENMKRAKSHNIDPNSVFTPFKTDKLPPKEALIWFFTRLDQAYHQWVPVDAFKNAQGKGLLQVYDETLKTLTTMAKPNVISLALIRLKSHWAAIPNNRPLY